MVDLQKKVRETGADLGAAFDGDATVCSQSMSTATS